MNKIFMCEQISKANRIFRLKKFMKSLPKKLVVGLTRLVTVTHLYNMYSSYCL